MGPTREVIGHASDREFAVTSIRSPSPVPSPFCQIPISSDKPTQTTSGKSQVRWHNRTSGNHHRKFEPYFDMCSTKVQHPRRPEAPEVGR
jgi:hypothetical protein